MSDNYGHLPRGPKRLLLASKWSYQGLKAAWLHESSFRLEVCLAAIAIPAALALGETGIERSLMVGSILIVLSVELLNSAIEAVIERFGSEHHVLAGRAKDMGSAAVSIVLMNVVATWILILV